MNELFGKNAKVARIFLLVYVLISIIVLIVIWWPKVTDDTADFAYYQEYTQEQVAEKMAKHYTDDIYNKIILSQSEEILNLIDEKYLEYNEFNKNDILDYLNENNIFDINTKIGQITMYIDGDNYIYSFNMINGNNSVKMNIIETHPYEYTITFDDYISYSEYEIINQFEGLSVSVKSICRTINSIEYTLEITNNNYRTVEFNLATVTDAYITHSDGSKLALANPIKYDNEKLGKGGSIRKKIRFDLPIGVQSKIESITFTNVILEGEEEEIIINI